MHARRYVIGIDEVGRGPLAGPVVVGAYAVPADASHAFLDGIRDSKACSPRARERWYAELTTRPQARFAVSFVGPEVIDARGIAWAIRAALSRSLRKLGIEPCDARVFLDGGLRAPRAYEHQQTVIRGDALIPVISAAAIVAKVGRDRYMDHMDRVYPKYGFARHKGYGTACHIEAIRTHGVTPLHRLTFLTRIVT